MRKGWKRASLGDLGKCINGLTYSPTDVTDSTGLLVLRSSNVQNGKLSFDDNVYVTKLVAKESLTKEGDILVCVRNGSKNLIGKNCLITKEASGNAHGAFMTLFRSQNPEFVYQLLQTDRYYNQVRRNLGATINSINTSDFYEFTFDIPPLPEQHKIAAILRTWDDAIEKIDSIIKLKEKKKAALAQRLLTGKVRQLSSTTSWKTVKLRTVTTEIKARNQDGALGLDKVMGVNKIHGLIPMREETIGASLDRYKAVPPEAFAYNPMRINIGSLAMSEKTETVLVSPDYVVFSCNEGQLDPWYFNQYRRSHIWEKYMEAAGNGSVRIRIYYNDLADMKIILPSFQEQKIIAAILNQSDLELKKLRTLLNTYKSQKRGLMQKLLTGEWRVNVSGDAEVA